MRARRHLMLPRIRLLDRIIVAWCRGREHPFRLRLIRLLLRLVRRRLVVPLRAGGTMTVDPWDVLQYSLLMEGAAEGEVWDALKSEARVGDVFWDIGANIGCMSIAAAWSGLVTEVHAFEPHPETFGLLRTHIEMNSDAPGGLRAHLFALGSKIEHRMLAPGPKDNIGKATLADSGEIFGMSIAVSCTTVDEVLRAGIAPPPDLVKMDIEGWEPHVIEGATALFAEHPPRAIVLEAAATGDGIPTDVNFFERLERLGYEWEHLPRPTGEIAQNENYIFRLRPRLGV